MTVRIRKKMEGRTFKESYLEIWRPDCFCFTF